MLPAGLAQTAERVLYRIAGLPVAVRGAQGADPLRSAFTRRYWHPDSASEWSELALGVVLSPLAILASSAWYTWRNGGAIRGRYGKSLPAQVQEQFKLYLSAGVLPPWYYIFALHDEGMARAPTFMERFETKSCYFRLLKQRKGTPLNDKVRFCEFATAHGIRCVPTVIHLAGASLGEALPEHDLFVKPLAGRGGRGAERWDWLGDDRFGGPNDEQLSGDALLRRLVERSRHQPLVVQPRLQPHHELAEITAGALPTVRVLTCLDEHGSPQVIAAMVRTSFGKNRTVDNLHAGGIGAMVDLETGTLSKASNLGTDAQLGWFSAHPDTGAPIEGRSLPCWDEVKRLAVCAHREFSDRVVIGWDIAILEDGPIFVEGNGNPDLDILQRFMRTGLRKHRFAELLAFHLRERGLA